MYKRQALMDYDVLVPVVGLTGPQYQLIDSLPRLEHAAASSLLITRKFRMHHRLKAWFRLMDWLRAGQEMPWSGRTTQMLLGEKLIRRIEAGPFRFCLTPAEKALWTKRIKSDFVV